jgi:hypothetical protein
VLASGTAQGVIVAFGSWTNAAMTMKDVRINAAASSAVFCGGRGSLSIKNSELGASSTNGIGLFTDWGDGNLPCDAKLTNVTIRSDAQGVFTRGSVEIRDSSVQAVSSLIANTTAGNTSKIVNSTISGGLQAWSLTKIENSELTGSLSGGPFQCLGNFDANLAPFVCPRK